MHVCSFDRRAARDSLKLKSNLLFMFFKLTLNLKILNSSQCVLFICFSAGIESQPIQSEMARRELAAQKIMAIKVQFTLEKFSVAIY